LTILREIHRAIFGGWNSRPAAESHALPAASQPDQQSLVVLDVGLARSDGNYNIAAAESHYQGRLHDVSLSGRSFTVMLMPEPTNAFDPNAIRIVEKGAGTIGYLSREDAASYAPVFNMLARHHCVGTCRARLTGGTDEQLTFGVALNLRDVSDLLTSVRDALEPGSPADANAEPF
jgi:hypothetical protein